MQASAPKALKSFNLACKRSAQCCATNASTRPQPPPSPPPPHPAPPSLIPSTTTRFATAFWIHNLTVEGIPPSAPKALKSFKRACNGFARSCATLASTLRLPPRCQPQPPLLPPQLPPSLPPPQPSSAITLRMALTTGLLIWRSATSSVRWHLYFAKSRTSSGC
jgi:hypothetical protein